MKMKIWIVSLVLVVLKTYTRADVPPQCRGIDLVFTVDSSASLGRYYFNFTKEFVVQVLNNLQNVNSSDPDGTAVGLVTFSSTSEKVFEVNKYETKADLLAGVRSAAYMSGATYTHLGIKAMTELLDNGRDGVQKIGVLITDGRSSHVELTSSAAMAYKAKDYLMMTIGVTDEAHREELLSIASNEKLVYMIEEFEELSAYSTKLFEKICEPCSLPSRKGYQHETCSLYWSCKDLKTNGVRCCGAGQSFINNECAPNPACRDNCPRPDNCERQPYPGDVTKFLEKVHGNWVPRPCARGAGYVDEDCECTMNLNNEQLPIRRLECTLDLYISFDTSVKDHNNRVKVTGANTITGGFDFLPEFVGKGAGLFQAIGGINHLYVDRWEGAHIGYSLNITFRFQENAQRTNIETIFTNGDCKTEGSASLSINSNLSFLKATVITSVTGRTEVYASYTQGGWKSVQFLFMNNELKLTVDSRMASQKVFGFALVRKSGLSIGGACGERGFVGLIDEFIVYDSCLPSTMNF